MNFKLMPFVTFNDADDVEGRKEAHYIFEMKSIAMEAIIMSEKDKDDPENYDTYTTESSYLNRRELAESILKGSSTLDGVKTIHFDDTCKVPRFKLGELCGKMGIKVVRKREDADAVIYGNKFVDSLFTSGSADSFNYKAAFIAQAKKVKNKRNLITEIIPLVEACESDVILLTNWDDVNNTYNRLCVQKAVKTDTTAEFDLDYTEVDDESKYILATGKQNMIYQDVILEQLSSVVMDEDMFISVDKMLESKDASNHLVAMEVMSNTAYRSSIVYLLELMRRHWDVIDRIHEKSNISFRALREYLQFEGNLNMDLLIDKIIEKNALTETNYKRILQFIMEDEANTTEDNSGRWIITNVDLHPEQKAKVIWDKKEELILTEAL